MTEEFGEAIAKAEQCYEDARYLFEGHRYEAAVNRAYYSIFSAIQGLLLSKDVFVKTHAGAKTKFHELYLKTNLLPIELGKILDNALTLRQEADYDFEVEVTAEDAMNIIKDAAKFLDAVKALVKSN